MKNWILRTGALGLAVVILPACNVDPWHWDDEHDVRVAIENTGAVGADVIAETSSWWDSPLERVEVRAGADETLQLRFRGDDVESLRVRIYRATDGLKLFDDTWDRDDLEDREGRIRVTVAP